MWRRRCRVARSLRTRNSQTITYERCRGGLGACQLTDDDREELAWMVEPGAGNQRATSWTTRAWTITSAMDPLRDMSNPGDGAGTMKGRPRQSKSAVLTSRTAANLKRAATRSETSLTGTVARLDGGKFLKERMPSGALFTIQRRNRRQQTLEGSVGIGLASTCSLSSRMCHGRAASEVLICDLLRGRRRSHSSR